MACLPLISRHSPLCLPACTALLFLCARSAPAQNLTLHAGAGYSSYDLSGTGSTRVAAARFALRVAGPLHGEIGGTFFRYKTQSEDRTTHVFPEVSAVLMV